MSACRSCGAEMIWTQTQNGKAMPVDAEPDPAGTFVLKYEGSQPVAVYDGMHLDKDPERYTSHFATCPDADEFRKGKR